jgi:hypothetical protein
MSHCPCHGASNVTLPLPERGQCHIASAAVQAKRWKADNHRVRKSFVAALLLAVVSAAVAAVVAFWLPARQARLDREWTAAGQRALAQVSAPAAFRPINQAGARISICVPYASQRCFLAAGSPRDNLPAVQAAFRSVATGPATVRCIGSPLRGLPATCAVTVSVKGSRLVADIFPDGHRLPGPSGWWSAHRSYVEIRVVGR